LKKKVIDFTPIYVSEDIYNILNPEYAEFIRCHKLLINGTSMVKNGFMTINDIAIHIEHPERGIMMGKFVNQCMYKNNGKWDIHVAGAIFNYCLNTLGYSPAYSNLLVKQIASSFNH